jgi:hypothetical protein
MNRSVCRIMVGVAGLAVLGMTATLAGVQTDEVKEKPPLYRYVSNWAFPPPHSADPDKDGSAGNQKILAAALADGTLVGYGDEENQVHFAEGFTHASWGQAKSIASLMKVVDALHKSGGSSSPLASSTRHWDQIYITSFYNWKAGSWKGAYGYSGTFKVKPDAPAADDVIRIVSSFYVPVFEKMLSDGIIVEYELDREIFHNTDSRSQIHFSFVMPNAEGLDKFRAALGDALDKNSLILPAVSSMMFDFNEQFNFVKVNATYK